MHRSLSIFALFLLLQTTTSAQRMKTWSPVMESMMTTWSEVEPFNIFVKGDRTHMQAYLLQGGLEVIGEAHGYQLIRVTKPVLRDLLDAGALSFIQSSLPEGRPMNDLMVINNNIIPLHQGVDPLPGALKGEGVLLGFVDTGVELQHPDFQLDNGNTRVVKIWDQVTTFDEEHIPQPYGFGTEWTREEIDDGQSNHLDQISWFGHGTHVTGIAAGDGSAINKYSGVAPESEIIAVSFDFNRPDFLGDVASSIQYIFDVADEEGKPCVINTSLGTYYGSHDGMDPASLYIDSLLDEAPGKAVVAAVGNSNNISPYHLHTEVGSDTSFTWFEDESNLFIGTSGVFFELWADVEDFSGVQFAMGVDKVNGGLENRSIGAFHNYTEMLGNTVTETLSNANGQVFGIVQYWAQLQGSQVQLQVYINDPDSTGYRYRFMSTGEGRFDVWSTNVFGTSDMIQSNLPNGSNFPAIANYVLPDRRMQSVSSWACSDKVITVANYVNRTEYVNYLEEITTIANETDGTLASSSSSGPSRDGRQKPDIAATGTVTLSTGSFAMLDYLIENEPFKVAPGGFHQRNGGSSMASPVVAGIAALFFEQCPLASWADFKAAVIEQAAADPEMPFLPDERWGWGKVDGFGTVISLTISPVVILTEDSLLASGGAGYQWYLDGEPLEGFTDDALAFQGNGTYQVEVFNALGCSAFSQEVVTTLDELALVNLSIRPNPSEGEFWIDNIPTRAEFFLYDATGRLLDQFRRAQLQSAPLDLQSYPAGIYPLRVRTDKQEQVFKLILSR